MLDTRPAIPLPVRALSHILWLRVPKHAAALGWPLERIIVIDTDLGQSGATAADREGFQRLVTEVSLGRGRHRARPGSLASGPKLDGPPSIAASARSPTR